MRVRSARRVGHAGNRDCARADRGRGGAVARRKTFLDFREKAPLAATPNMFRAA